MFAFGWPSCGRKPECPEETHLSDLVTKQPAHMPTPGIDPGSQRWEASELTLRQPDSRVDLYLRLICFKTRRWNVLTYLYFHLQWIKYKTKGHLDCLAGAVHRLQLLSFHGHCPRKDHHGTLFTSCIAFYGLIPSSTMYAWYVNTNMVPIFRTITELWELYHP